MLLETLLHIFLNLCEEITILVEVTKVMNGIKHLQSVDLL